MTMVGGLTTRKDACRPRNTAGLRGKEKALWGVG